MNIQQYKISEENVYQFLLYFDKLYDKFTDLEKKEFGSKLSSLYISQVKRKCEIEVEENYNLPKSGNERVSQCPKEKEDVNKHVLKYFAMI